MLYVGRDNRQSAENRNVEIINTQMENFCILNGFTYIPHSSLNKSSCNLYRDDVHIDNDGGTAVFCSDIFRATGYHKSKDTRDNQRLPSGPPGKPMFFYNQRERPGNNQSAPAKPHQRRANVHSEPGANLNQMMSLLCMNMLRQQGINF